MDPDPVRRAVDRPTSGQAAVALDGAHCDAQAMAGYLGRPDATAAMIGPDGWLRSGDLAHVDGEGDIFVIDRLRELIKVNALQVAPAELEALLVTHPAVADAAVVPRPDERCGEVPVAIVVDSGQLDPGELHGLGRRARGAVQARSRRARRGAIPRSPSGKILRRSLVPVADEVAVAGR